MKKYSNKTYKIETLNDIAEIINAENVDNFIEDFVKFCATVVMLKQLGQKKVEPVNFTWTDDNKKQYTINLIPKVKPSK